MIMINNVSVIQHIIFPFFISVWQFSLLYMCKAFDLLDFKILLCKLKLYGCSNLTVKWFKSYLMGRTQNVLLMVLIQKVILCNMEYPKGLFWGRCCL